MEPICSRCGCSSFHYNRARMRMECDSCGAPVRDAQRDQQLMQYDRTYAQAMSHLAAGNWDRAIDLLRPLLGQYPTEKRLYLGILRAATQDFRDTVMANPARRCSASDAWNKLVRLNGVTDEMVRYGRRRFELRREAAGARRNRILGWIFAAALCLLFAGALSGLSCDGAGLLFAAGAAGCLYMAARLRPVEAVRELLRAAPDVRSDPFL